MKIRFGDEVEEKRTALESDLAEAGLEEGGRGAPGGLREPAGAHQGQIGGLVIAPARDLQQVGTTSSGLGSAGRQQLPQQRPQGVHIACRGGLLAGGRVQRGRTQPGQMGGGEGVGDGLWKCVRVRLEMGMGMREMEREMGRERRR